MRSKADHRVDYKICQSEKFEEKFKGILNCIFNSMFIFYNHYELTILVEGSSGSVVTNRPNMYNDSNTIDNHSCFHNCTSMCARFVVISHSDSNAFVPSFCTSIIPIIICIHLEGGKIGMRWQSHCLNVLA